MSESDKLNNKEVAIHIRNVDADLRKKFKIACIENNTTIGHAIQNFMKKMVKEYEKRKGIKNE